MAKKKRPAADKIAVLQSATTNRCKKNFENIFKKKLLSIESININQQMRMKQQNGRIKSFTMKDLIDEFNEIKEKEDVTTFEKEQLEHFMLKSSRLFRRLMIHHKKCHGIEKHDFATGRYQIVEEENFNPAGYQWKRKTCQPTKNHKIYSKFNKYCYKMIISKGSFQNVEQFMGQIAKEVVKEICGIIFHQRDIEANDPSFVKVYEELLKRCRLFNVPI